MRMSSSTVSVGRVLSAITAGLLCLGLIGIGAARASEEEQAAVCPPQMNAHGGAFFNTYPVDQLGGGAEGSTIPFTASSYEYMTGNALAGEAWYRPSPRQTVYQGMTFEWLNARVHFTCHTVWVGYLFELRIHDSWEGVAVLSSSRPPGQEEWRRGSSSEGDSGGEECWEVWLVWRNEWGWIEDEEYLGDVCFETGGGGGVI
jgi:hypothetical protein